MCRRRFSLPPEAPPPYPTAPPPHVRSSTKSLFPAKTLNAEPIRSPRHSQNTPVVLELLLADLPVLTEPTKCVCVFFGGRVNNLFLFILCVFAQRYCIDATRVCTAPFTLFFFFLSLLTGVGEGVEGRGGLRGRSLMGTSHAH